MDSSELLFRFNEKLAKMLRKGVKDNVTKILMHDKALAFSWDSTIESNYLKIIEDTMKR